MLAIGDKLVLDGIGPREGQTCEVVIRKLHPICVEVLHEDGAVRSYYIGPGIEWRGIMPPGNWQLRKTYMKALRDASELPFPKRGAVARVLQQRMVSTAGSFIERLEANIG